MQTVLAFIVALCVLIYVHEMGHYLAARACGVKVLRFSIGFGRPLLRWISKSRDRTEWTVAMIPLGGYVKMLDERELDPARDTPIDPADLPRAFNRQPVGKRFAIVAAGPLANFALAIALYFALFAGGMREPVPVVAEPAAGTMAAQAGVRDGDRVLSLTANGHTEPVRSWNDLRMAVFAEGFGDARAVLRVRGADGAERDVTLPRLPNTGGNPEQDPLATLGLNLKGGPVTITEVLPDSAAERAGLRKGDRIVAWQGSPLTQASALIKAVRSQPGQAVTLGIERDGQRLDVPVTLDTAVARDGATDASASAPAPSGKLGAALSQAVQMETVRYRPDQALARAAGQVWDTSVLSLKLLGKMLVGQASLQNLSGPLTVADYAGRAANLGIQAFVSFLALVSVSLGVLNLLPIPVLDGGHLLYYCVEFLTGRPVPDHWQAMLQKVGIACILLLTSLALFNDVSRMFLANG
ncbi:RIP metalloprotease RseP [Cupriavidus taiwanensis]|uniref:Zinc metalloprotease n=1 Tax=Cupriavidus taiwanensis TaxID=164546 RepID=A0A7Z7JBA3_9BURK|nr:RIP metalloprotease RseP [Cupriavidus taiwanensis]SOY87625.1 membrane-associated protease [Cupriavidus taiwanensis]SOZ05526.1 membrane-associated protease [Cupriavidus taiwanensis]SOZ07510.1 membrane-associated protease [Cupriavidus taiwanensis]SPC15550.1 membrane-associated protease [Cupriavidus taiwanensis]SPD40193.1 putative enzyme [Cupriavidus taiwanensis]